MTAFHFTCTCSKRTTFYADDQETAIARALLHGWKRWKLTFLICPDCEVPAKNNTCNDCGTSPVWWYSRSERLTYCRRCHEKNGYYHYPEIDPDELKEWLRDLLPNQEGKSEEQLEALVLDIFEKCVS